jgi:nickel-type superoxide dismutase maturation protease
MRNLLGPLAAILGAIAGATAVLLAARRLDVVEVTGSSMVPALLPGDRLLVESLSLRLRSPRTGEVVLALDPRDPSRELIKRVASVEGAELVLRGDHPSASTDSREFGPITRQEVAWRAVLRYWPPLRAGRLPRPDTGGDI